MKITITILLILISLLGIWCLLLGFGLMDYNNVNGRTYFISGSILLGSGLNGLVQYFKR